MDNGQQGVIYDSNFKMHFPEGTTHMTDFPEELLPVVNQHWADFDPQHPLIRHVFGIAFLLLTFVNFFANFLIIFVYINVDELRTPANMLMVNLAISDLGIFTTQGPLMFINAFASPFWMWGSFMCRLYGCLGGIFGVCSLMTLTFIAYDRYQVICFGLEGKRMTSTRSLMIILFCWTYSTLTCIPPFFGWGSYKLEGLFQTCSYEYLSDDYTEKSFVLFAFVFSYVVPLSFVLFFYKKIIISVFFTEAAFKRAQTKLMNASNLPHSRKEFTLEKRIAKVALMNVLIWVLAWTPYAGVALTGVFGNKQAVTPLVSQIPSFLAKLASCLNPLVMMMSHPKYRYHLKQQFPWMCISEVPPIQETVDETPTVDSSA